MNNSFQGGPSLFEATCINGCNSDIDKKNRSYTFIEYPVSIMVYVYLSLLDMDCILLKVLLITVLQL